MFGLVALISLPREEEPRISVPMVDIHVRADGLRAEDAVKLITEPLETIVKGIDGVEHVYSQSQDDLVMVTARFVVGTSSDAAVLRVHDKVRANMDRIPVGVPEPLIVGRGIDDVAILALTLSPRPAAADRITANDLTRIARELRTEIAKIADVGLTYLVGETGEMIRIAPDPERLALYGVTLQQLAAKVSGANTAFPAGRVRDAGEQITLVAGETLRSPDEIGNLLVTTRDDRPVYVRDVAEVGFATESGDALVSTVAMSDGAPERRAVGDARHRQARRLERGHRRRGDPAPGRGAGGIADPRHLTIEVTRDYGETANEKANELLYHLGLATLSIIGLVVIAIGWREGIVVAVVIPVTILLTLFASWLMGYTLNRVSLFALIFSIGILVDDAIVVIENIARHWGMGDARDRRQAAIEAVAEVGNPTIIATFTVVAALASDAVRLRHDTALLEPDPGEGQRLRGDDLLLLRGGDGHALADAQGRRPRARRGSWRPRPRRCARAGLCRGRPPAAALQGAELAVPARRRRPHARLAVALLHQACDREAAALRQQVRALGGDRPAEGSSVEATDAVAQAVAAVVLALPEVRSVQVHAGTAAPFNFNGLVRHSYLRAMPEQGDVAINLLPKAERDRPSHAIALDIRQRLAAVAVPRPA